MRSYLELVEVLQKFGAAPKLDMQALWRRVVFNILISNTDDHLRNHGFIWSGPKGWRLSPAYDLNPVPTDLKPRVLSTSINYQDSAASMDLAFEVAHLFEISASEARKIALEVGEAVSKWRTVAKKICISSDEVSRMATAIEHKDLEISRRKRIVKKAKRR